jgi:hypothetical protein
MKKLLLATVALAVMCAPAMAATPKKATRTTSTVSSASSPWINPFATVSVSPNSIYGDVGAVAAINRNLNTDGFLVRATVYGGSYEYNRTATAEQDANFIGGNVMGGYHWFLGGGSLFTVYGGLDISDTDDSNTGAVIRGTETGFKGMAELYLPLADKFYAHGTGSYSTVWDSYYTQGKVGYQICPTVSIGPEVAALGNDRFDGVHTGGFAAWNAFDNVQVIGSVGYNMDTHDDAFGDDDDGIYGGVHVRALY